jgi:hypothetical protein
VSREAWDWLVQQCTLGKHSWASQQWRLDEVSMQRQHRLRIHPLKKVYPKSETAYYLEAKPEREFTWKPYTKKVGQTRQSEAGMYVDLIKLLLEYAGKLRKPLKNLRSKQKFGYSSHDVDMLQFFYPCFDRAAFQHPFSIEVPADMFRAIKDTILALSVGIRRTRDGQEIGRGKGKAEFESPELRATFDAVVSLLNDVIKALELGVASGALEISGHCLIVRHSGIGPFIDETRNKVLTIVNSVFSQIDRPSFPMIPSSREWHRQHLRWLEDRRPEDRPRHAYGSQRGEEAVKRFFEEYLGYLPPPPLGDLGSDRD